jgi:hypothetical protein
LSVGLGARDARRLEIRAMVSVKGASGVLVAAKSSRFELPWL